MSKVLFSALSARFMTGEVRLFALVQPCPREEYRHDDRFPVTSDASVCAETPPTTITVLDLPHYYIFNLFTVGAGGYLTLRDNITINSSTSIIYARNGGNVYINGTTLTSTSDEQPMVFATGADSEEGDPYIAINDDSTLSSKAAALTVTNGADADINGGRVSTYGASTPVRAVGSGSIVTIKAGSVVVDGQPAVNSSVDFIDVSADQWYSSAIAWASSNGIVLGYGDGTFGTDDTHTSTASFR